MLSTAKSHSIRTTFLTYAVAPICLLTLPCSRVAAEREQSPNDFYLRNDDRVVFYGDSITEQGTYTAAIETFVLTRCPAMKVTFINSGWAGDRIWGGEGGTTQERIRRDVIANRPTVVTLMLGMNDAYYSAYDPKILQDFVGGLESIIVILQRDLPDVRITLLSSSPFDDISPGPRPKWEEAIDGGYNAVIDRFGQAVRDVAGRHKLLFVDINQPIVDLLTSAKNTKPELCSQLIPDRIHPGHAAGLVMAMHLLKAWKAPQTTTSVHINGATGIVESATYTTVTHNTKNSGLHWTQQELALPYPIDRKDAATRLVQQISPELKILRQDLRITNFLDNALLQIDGQSVGTFSAKALADGIDLSSLPTPMNRQSEQVARLGRLRNQLHFTRWRQIQIPFANESSSRVGKAVEELNGLEAQLLALQRAAAQPISHTFELKSP